jgi:hypothetical protein
MATQWNCPKCSTINPEHAKFCGGCGAPAPQPDKPPPGSAAQPPLGATGASPPAGPGQTSQRVIFALIAAALGLMCCPAGIVGIVLAQMELKAIRDGHSAKSNEKMAQIAFYASIATTLIGMLVGLFLSLIGMVRH